jgi:hypothetical protein
MLGKKIHDASNIPALRVLSRFSFRRHHEQSTAASRLLGHPQGRPCRCGLRRASTSAFPSAVRLAKKLGKKKKEVFPIAYDVSAFVKGSSRCVRGTIPEKPAKRLSRTQMIELMLMD